MEVALGAGFKAGYEGGRITFFGNLECLKHMIFAHSLRHCHEAGESVLHRIRR